MTTCEYVIILPGRNLRLAISAPDRQVSPGLTFLEIMPNEFSPATVFIFEGRHDGTNPRAERFTDDRDQ